MASPYVKDNWKVNPKLNLDLGLRWDYIPPFHEVKDRWSYLNPNLTNPLTNTPGEMQFAGNYGGAGVSCGCKTPVQTYWKNFGPRVGLNYSVDDKTVFSAGGALVFSQAGGVGGRGGNAGGTGQLGFNIAANGNPESTTGISAASVFLSEQRNRVDGEWPGEHRHAGQGLPLPDASRPECSQPDSEHRQLPGHFGEHDNRKRGWSVVRGLYLTSGRARIVFWNAGIQRSLTKEMTIAVKYVGDQSHFLSTGGNIRGYWADQMDPNYLAALGSVTDSTNTKPILIRSCHFSERG